MADPLEGWSVGTEIASKSREPAPSAV